MKKIGVAIMGLGVVGGGTYKMLNDNAEYYKKVYGVDFSVVGVLERNKARALELGVLPQNIYDDVNKLMANSDLDIVVECIGGIEPAKAFVLKAFENGKSVVTSNKELVSKYWHELEKAAKRKNCGFLFEASCMGGVPVIRTMLDGICSNKILSIMGIVNGTTNYILTKMSDEGVSYEEAIAQAKKLGYAEANPAADVEGYDSMYKLSILSSLAFHKKVPISKIYREGISQIDVQDIEYGKNLGYSMKLLAIGKNTDAGIEARVHPAFIKNDHILASTNGSFNNILIKGENLDDIALYGKGAGAMPTASAIVSDIIYAATHSEKQYSTFKNNISPDKDVKFISNFESKYYLRISCFDKPGILSRLTSIFARCGISITDFVQHSTGENTMAPMLIITYKTNEFAVRNAVAKINKLEGIAKVQAVIRVEE